MKLRVASAAVLAAGAMTVAGGAAVSARPALLILQAEPTVKVAGTNFQAREAVRVVLKTDVASRGRWVHASRHGSFYADVGALPEGFERCKSVFSVVARGATGNRAVARNIVRECPPPL